MELDLEVVVAPAEAGLERIERGLPPKLAELAMEAARMATGEIRAVLYETSAGATGNLARSFREVWLGSDGTVTGAGSVSDSIYARVQEVGGVIRPRVRRMLAIPLPGAGVPFGMWPSQWAKGELYFSKGMLWATRDHKPRYSLKREVTLRAKGYLRIASERIAPQLAQLFGEGVGTVIRGAGMGGP